MKNNTNNSNNVNNVNNTKKIKLSKFAAHLVDVYRKQDLDSLCKEVKKRYSK